MARIRTILTRKQEQDLSGRIHAGDLADPASDAVRARNVLVMANQGLVVSIARHFEGRGLALEDLVGEGNLGIIRAAAGFDAGLGGKFGTYATYRIREAIGEALRDTTAPVRVPAHAYKLLGKWNRVERAMVAELGHPVEAVEVSAWMGLDEQGHATILRARAVGDVRGIAFASGGWLAHDPAADAGEIGRLAEGLARLDPVERLVVAMRYGLEGGGMVRAIEVSRRLGMSSQAVRRIESAALGRLRELLGGAVRGKGAS